MADGATIERLQVEVSASSTDAAQKLQELIGKLTALKTACNGGAGLKSVVNSLNKLKDASNAIGSGNVDKLSSLADALMKLQGIGKFTVSKKAADQLVRLAQVSQIFKDADFSGFTRLSEALAPLASQLETIGQAIPPVAEGLEDLSEATSQETVSNNRARKSTLNLAATFAVAYKSVQKAAQGISNLIDKSNTYIENLNLFNASLGQYADKAQEYAEKVGDLMGIDPGAWMRNQGVFQTLATGFGVSADRAYIMSKNLTQLGYDLSSFFNIAVDGEGGAMQKLQAGLSGELEPLRRLGYDLSQAKLKAVALSLGIDQTFNSMTQAQKAQLRYYAIMTQVTKAQGDMARTLDTPANQLRVLKAQAEQAARSLGNIFIPVLNKILPYAIATAKAIRMVADAIADFFGFTLPEVDYSGLNTAVDATEDIDDAMDSAYGSAKKMNELLASWDELNIIASETGGSGGGGSASSYNAEDWNWELPEYDFLNGLIESNANKILETWQPTIDWIKDNINDVLKLAEAVGLAVIGWKVSGFISSLGEADTFMNNTLLSTIGAVAAAALSIVLSVNFTADYLESGSILSLVGSLFTDTIGAILVKRMLSSRFGASLGSFWASALFVVQGGIKLVMSTKDAETEGLTTENMVTAAIGAAEVALGAGLIAKAAFGDAIATGSILGGGVMLFSELMATFILSQKIAEINGGKDPYAWFGSKIAEVVGYGAGGLILSKKLLHLGTKATWTMTGVAVGITSVINLVTTLGDAMRDGWTDLTFAKALAGAIGFGVSAAMILKGLGVVSGVYGMLAVGAAALVIALGATVVVYLNSPKVDDQVTLDWGDIELTADEVRAKAESYFQYDLTAHIDSITITHDDGLVDDVNSDLSNLEKEVRGLNIGLDKESSYTAIKNILVGEDGQMGEGTLIGDVKKLISDNAATISDFVKIGNGTVEGGADLVSLMNLTSTDITNELTAAGKLWGEYFSDGFEVVASEAANNLLTYIYDITAAAARGTRQADLQIKLGGIKLQDMTSGSALSTVKEYLAIIDEELAAYKRDEDEAFRALSSQYSAYQTMVDEWELAHPGEEAPAEYKARLTQLEQDMNEYLHDIENGKYSKALEMWREDIHSSVQVVEDELMGIYGNLDFSKFNFTGDFTDASKNMTLGNRQEALFAGLDQYYAGELSKASLNDIIDDYLWTLLQFNMKAEDFAPLELAFQRGILNPRDLFDQSDIEEIIRNEFTWLNKQSLQTGEFEEGGLLRQFWQENFPTPDTSGAVNTMNELAQTVSADTQSIKTDLQSLDGISVNISGSVSFPRVGTFRLPKFAASGGVFDTGEMFVAREAGPELVGRIGHRTSVANNDQIEGGIASGVREANSEQNALLAESNRYLRVLASKRFTLEPSTALARTVKRSEEMRLQSEGV